MEVWAAAGSSMETCKRQVVFHTLKENAKFAFAHTN
jgi:hypothetical protein